MTAVNRDAIVDAAARAKYLDDRTRGGEGPFTWPEWDDLPAFEQAICREDVLPAVTATLAALEPVAARYVELADGNEQLIDPDATHGTAMCLWGGAYAYRDAAAILRKVWAL